MSHRKIRRHALDARVITIRQWTENCAPLNDVVRPVVLRINERHGLVTIRPKRPEEIREAKRRLGLPVEDAVMETREGSLVGKTEPVKLIREAE